MKYVDINPSNFYQHRFVDVASNMREFIYIIGYTNIVHFSHVRTYKDQSKCLITTHPEFSELFIKQGFYKRVFCADPSKYKKGLALVKNIDCHEIENGLAQCQIGETAVFVNPTSEYTDFWYFGAKLGTENMGDFYCANIDLLEKFISYFQQRGKRLLDHVYDNQLIYPGQLDDKTLLVSNKWDQINLLPQRDKLSIIHADRIDENSLLFELALSKRFTLAELRCAYYLRKGCVPKEIARYTNISVRTVEKHLINLKNKMNSRSLIHLVSQLHTSKQPAVVLDKP